MSRRPSAEHQEAVSRRLAQLSAELAEVRPDLDAPTRPRLGEAPTEAPHDLFTHTRVRPGPGWPPQAVRGDVAGPADGDRTASARGDRADGAEAVVPPVPRPGRHAARRPARGAAGALPETLRGRVTLGPAQLALVAVVVTVGLAVTTWWVVRGDARPLAAPVVTGTAPDLASAVPSPPAGATVPTSGTSPASGTVTVDVAGKVRRPGIAVLDAGSRVVDALEAAGGARPGVDLAALNLARLLVDGEQILVGERAPIGAGSVSVAPPAAGAQTALVNLNTADLAELETLPDVGPVTAEAIIAWRTEHGGFTSVDELLEIDGIGEATLETIAPHVTV